MTVERLLPESITRHIVKIACTVPISSELLRQSMLGGELPEVTDEDRARWARQKAEVEAWKAALKAGLEATTDPVVRAVAELHTATDSGYCGGCDFGGYEAEPVDWPCNTSALLGRHIGIETPAHWSSW